MVGYGRFGEKKVTALWYKSTVQDRLTDFNINIIAS